MSSGKPRWPAAPASRPSLPGKICPSCPLAATARRWRDKCWTSTPRSCPKASSPTATIATRSSRSWRPRRRWPTRGSASSARTRYRVGVIMGAGMGGMLIGEEEFAKVYMSNRPASGPPQLHPDDHAQLGLGHHGDDVQGQGAQSHDLDGVLIERSRHRALAGRDPCRPGRRGHHRRGGSEPHPAGLCRLLRAPRAVDARTTISPRGPPARSSARATDS